MMYKQFTLATIALLQLALASGAHAEGPEYGPSNGTLVIIGGGTLRNTGIIERFIELAGGPTKKFIIVPTARGNRNPDGTVRKYSTAEILGPWLKFGLRNTRMLHTHDPKIADTEEFVRELRDADAVWFDGGRQWNLVDSYANTRTLVEFRKLLERGAVIAGTSAGATILGEYLVRGDTSGPMVMMTQESNHQQGFSLLRGTAMHAGQKRDRSAQ